AKLIIDGGTAGNTADGGDDTVTFDTAQAFTADVTVQNVDTVNFTAATFTSTAAISVTAQKAISVAANTSITTAGNLTLAVSGKFDQSLDNMTAEFATSNIAATFDVGMGATLMSTGGDVSLTVDAFVRKFADFKLDQFTLADAPEDDIATFQADSNTKVT